MMPQSGRQTNQRGRQATTAASPPSPALMHSASAGPSGRRGVGILRAGAPPRLGGSSWRPLEALKPLLAERRGPILPLQRRCWLQPVILAESWPNWRSRLCLLPFSVFFRRLLLCSAMPCFVVVSPSRLLSIKTEPRMELAVPVCRNRRRMQLLPFHDSPCSSLALSHPPRDDSDPASAGNPTRRDTSQARSRHRLPWQHARRFPFFFLRPRLRSIVCYFYDALDSSFVPPFFSIPMGAEPVSPLLKLPNFTSARVVARLPAANSPSLL